MANKCFQTKLCFNSHGFNNCCDDIYNCFICLKMSCDDWHYLHQMFFLPFMFSTKTFWTIYLLSTWIKLSVKPHTWYSTIRIRWMFDTHHFLQLCWSRNPLILNFDLIWYVLEINTKYIFYFFLTFFLYCEFVTILLVLMGT